MKFFSKSGGPHVHLDSSSKKLLRVDFFIFRVVFSILFRGVLAQEFHAAVSLPSLIPLDAPNHDGWNVLFNDSAKLEDKLILSDGCKSFTSDPVERFGVFAQSGLDWKFARSKHRELPSMWSLFTPALFWFLHILVFVLSTSWVARDDLPISVFFKSMHFSCPVLLLQPRLV